MRAARKILLALAAIALVGATGCGPVRPCKPDSILVSLLLEGAATTADTLDFAVDGITSSTLTASVPHTSGAAMGSVELDFASAYPFGKTAQITVNAKKGGQVLSTGQASVTLGGECVQVSIAVRDLAMDDAGMDDLAPTDDLSPGDDIAPGDDLGTDDAATTDGGVDGGPLDGASDGALDGASDGPRDGASFDLARLVDLSVPVDLAKPADLTMPIVDLTMPDLTIPPDLMTCSAVPPAAAHFVDLKLGTDDPNHGGAPGACAYRTLTYALSQATATISLAPYTYDATTGETAPFKLTALQDIQCNGATLGGGIVIAGAQNSLRSCRLVGSSTVSGSSGSCVDVNSPGQGSGHLIDKSDISGCQNPGIANVVNNGAGGNLTVSSTSFHDIPNISGVFWVAGAPLQLLGNGFAPTVKGTSGGQIYCSTANQANVVGSGNFEIGGAKTANFCANCANCPNL